MGKGVKTDPSYQMKVHFPFITPKSTNRSNNTWLKAEEFQIRTIQRQLFTE